MYLLYVDESGNYADPADHFAVGGLAIHEQDIKLFRKRVDESVKRNIANPAVQALEIHAQHIRSGKGGWRGVPHQAREGLLLDLCSTIARFSTRRPQPFALFSVTSAPGSIPHADRLERCFEELFLRFNQFLIRQNRYGPGPLGLIIADRAKYEGILQPIARQWHEEGTRFKRLRRLIEVPLFCDSEETKLIQMADLVVHSIYRKYARADSTYSDLLMPSFDTEGDVIHGMTHLTTDFRSCACEACASRRPNPSII